MLTVDEAKRIATDWRPRFRDEVDFEKSWQRYFESATVPDEERLVPWLAQDLERAEVKYMGIPREPLVPMPSRFESSSCSICRGLRYVRLDIDMDDARFGKAFACPDCADGRRSDLITQPHDDVLAPRSGNWCWKCRAGEDQSANETCSNPNWHWPNWNGMLHSTVTADTVLKRF